MVLIFYESGAIIVFFYGQIIRTSCSKSHCHYVAESSLKHKPTWPSVSPQQTKHRTEACRNGTDQEQAEGKHTGKEFLGSKDPDP